MGKRKKGKGFGEGLENSLVRMVHHKLMEGMSPSKTEAGE